MSKVVLAPDVLQISDGDRTIYNSTQYSQRPMPIDPGVRVKYAALQALRDKHDEVEDNMIGGFIRHSSVMDTWSMYYGDDDLSLITQGFQDINDDDDDAEYGYNEQFGLKSVIASGYHHIDQKMQDDHETKVRYLVQLLQEQTAEFSQARDGMDPSSIPQIDGPSSSDDTEYTDYPQLEYTNSDDKTPSHDGGSFDHPPQSRPNEGGDSDDDMPMLEEVLHHHQQSSQDWAPNLVGVPMNSLDDTSDDEVSSDADSNDTTKSKHHEKAPKHLRDIRARQQQANLENRRVDTTSDYYGYGIYYHQNETDKSQYVYETDENGVKRRVVPSQSQYPKPLMDFSGGGNKYDFRENELPAGVEVIGKARFERNNDGSTAMLLENHTYLKLRRNFNSSTDWFYGTGGGGITNGFGKAAQGRPEKKGKKGKKGKKKGSSEPRRETHAAWTIVMEVQWDQLPDGNASLLMTNIDSGTDGECFLNKEGGVGLFDSFGEKPARIREGRWNHIVITKTGSSLRTYINGHACATVNISSDDKGKHANRFHIDQQYVYLFASGNKHLMPGGVRIKSIRVLDGEKDEAAVAALLLQGKSFSVWEREVRKANHDLQRKFSLSQFYARPPPVWYSELFKSHMISNYMPIPLLRQQSFESASILILSSVLKQIPHTQHQLLSILPPHTPTILNNFSNALEISSLIMSKSSISVFGQAKYIVTQIEKMVEGNILFIPFHVPMKDPFGNEAPALAPIIMGVERVTQDLCRLTISTLHTEFLRYHPQSSGSDDDSILVTPTIPMDGIPFATLKQPLLWITMLAHRLAKPHVFYYSILPLFTGVPWDVTLKQFQSAEAKMVQSLLAFNKADISRLPTISNHQILRLPEDDDDDDHEEESSSVVQLPNRNHFQDQFKHVTQEQKDEYYAKLSELRKFDLGIDYIRYQPYSADQLWEFVMKYYTRRYGLSTNQADLCYLAVQCRLLDYAYNDLALLPSIQIYDLNVLNYSVRAVSHRAADILEVSEHDVMSRELFISSSQPASIQESITMVDDEDENDEEWEKISASSPQVSPKANEKKSDAATRVGIVLYSLQRALGRLNKEISAAPIYNRPNSTQSSLLLNDSGRSLQSQHQIFPLGDNLPRLEDVNDQIGTPHKKAGYIPVNYLLIPRSVSTLDDIIRTIKHCDRLVALTHHQRNQIKKAHLLVVSTIQYAFSEVIPVPVSHKASDDEKAKCLWHSAPFRFGQIIDLLIVLHRLTSHLIWSSSSGEAPMAAVVCVLSGVLAVIADFLIHSKTSDTNSDCILLLLRGDYGLSMAYFDTFTESIRIPTVALTVARSRIADYLSQSEYRNPIFTLTSNKMEPVYTGLASEFAHARSLPLTGPAALFSRSGYLEFYFPEFIYYRNISVMFRISCMDPYQSPISSRIDSDIEVPVLTFRNENVTPYLMYNTITITAETMPKRLPTSSSADWLYREYLSPTMAQLLKKREGELDKNEINGYLQHKIETEDDVLHAKYLPSFMGFLNQADSEILLSYLTTPYLRIPLVIAFFSSEDRIHALKEVTLQAVLYSCLFEPGRFVSHERYGIIPTTVPSIDQDLLGTRYGLLSNEIIKSPHGLVDGMLTLLRLALALDTGTIHASTVPTILFIVRVISQVSTYFTWITNYLDNKHPLYPYGSLPGLHPHDSVKPLIYTGRQRLVAALRGEVLAKLTRWDAELFNETHLKLTSTVYAHHEALQSIQHAAAATSKGESQSQKGRKGKNDAFDYQGQVDGPDARQITYVPPSATAVVDDTTSRRHIPTPIGATPFEEVQNIDVDVDNLDEPDKTLYGRIKQNYESTQLPFTEDDHSIISEFAESKIKTKRKCMTLPDLSDKTDGEAGSDGNRQELNLFQDRLLDMHLSTDDEITIEVSIAVSCEIASHILCICSDLRDDEFNSHTVGLALSSMMYLNTHHTWNEALRLNDLYIIYSFYHIRPQIIQYIHRLPQTSLNKLMNIVVNVAACRAVFTDDPSIDNYVVAKEKFYQQHRQAIDACTAANSCEKYEHLTITEAVWGALPGAMNFGRYVTAMLPTRRTILDQYNDYTRKPRPIYSKHLDVDIDIQVLQITLQQAHLVAIPLSITSNPHFRAVFPRNGLYQGAIIEYATMRSWYRLVGYGYDLYLWTAQEARFQSPLDRIYSYGDLFPSEHWITPLFEPIRLEYFDNPCDPTIFYMPDHALPSDARVARLFGINKQITVEVFVYKDRQMVQIYGVLSYGRRAYRSLIYSTDYRFSLKPLLYKNNNELPFEAGQLSLPDAGFDSSQVVITRDPSCADNLSGLIETYMPYELLTGIIPSCLFQQYQFWQDEDDYIRGYPKDLGNANDNQSEEQQYIAAMESSKDASHNSGASRHQHYLYIELLNIAKQDMLSTPGVSVRVRRLSREQLMKYNKKTSSNAMTLPQLTNESPSTTPATVAPTTLDEQALELVNLLHAPKFSSTYQLATVLSRIHDLSGLLVWKPAQMEDGLNLTQDQRKKLGYITSSTSDSSYNDDNVQYAPALVDPDVEIDVDPILDVRLIQIPALGLSFQAKHDSKGDLHLYSLDHSDLYISNYRSPLINKLVEGIPHSLILQNEFGELSILVPAYLLSRQVPHPSAFSTLHETFLSQMENKYFLYPVHVSLSFLFTPTLASSLYLLALRYLNDNYAEAFKLVDSIASDTEYTPEEAAILNLLAENSTPVNPDASACLLKISYATLDAQVVELPWDILPHVVYYSGNGCHRFTSAQCRLALHEELTLIKYCFPDQLFYTMKKMINSGRHSTYCSSVLLVYNRMQWLDALIRGLPSYKAQFLWSFKSPSQHCFYSAKTLRVEDLLRWYYHTKTELPAREGGGAIKRKRYSPNNPPDASSMNDNADEDIEDDQDQQNDVVPSATPKAPTKTVDLFSHYDDVLPPEMQRLLPSHISFNTDLTSVTPQTAAPIKLSNMQIGSIFSERMLSINSGGNGFLYIYMLLIGEANVKLLGEDVSHDLGRILTHLLGDVSSYRNPFVFVLRLMVLRPELCSVFPRIGPNPSQIKFAPFFMAICRCIAHLYKRDSRVVTLPIIHRPIVSAPPTVALIYPQRDRFNITPSVSNYDCSFRLLNGINLNNDAIQRLLSSQDGLTNKRTAVATAVTKGVLSSQQQTLLDVMTSSASLATLDTPLAAIGIQKYLTTSTRQSQGIAEVSSCLSFNVTQHPASQSHVARAMVNRLEDDVVLYADKQNSLEQPSMIGLLRSEIVTYVTSTQEHKETLQSVITSIEELATSLNDLKEKDRHLVQQGILLAVSIANSVSLPQDLNLLKPYHISSTLFTNDENAQAYYEHATAGEKHHFTHKLHYLLRRQSLQESTLWVEYLIASLLSSCAVFDLQKVNPYLTLDHITCIFAIVETVLLHANRIGHINRCLNESTELLQLLQRTYDGQVDSTGANAMIAGLTQKSNSLATLLTASRHYLDQVHDQTIVENNTKLLLDKEVIDSFNASHQHGSKSKKSNPFLSRGIPQHLIQPCAQLQMDIRNRKLTEDVVKARKRREYHPFAAFCSVSESFDFAINVLRHNYQDRYETLKAIHGASLNARSGIEIDDIWFVLNEIPTYVSPLEQQLLSGRYGLTTLSQSGVQVFDLSVYDGDTTHTLSHLPRGAIRQYDPRFLVFEFTWNLLLRKPQVQMVREFSTNIREGKSVVKQMIMGAGKTTVVAPLLTLMLGDGKHIVMEVVPPALLEFSRSIMRSTFSSVMYKRIYTFHFERATQITHSMVSKLNSAIRSRGVVISSPTSVKSVMLRFLEIQYSITTPSSLKERDLENQLKLLAQVLHIFRDGYLLMDEVDLILHPLKSELNFPFGEKHDLNFAPLRWTLAIHILDSMFFTEYGVVPLEFRESKRAYDILAQIRTAVQLGYHEKSLQQSPHLILLNEDYYHDVLKPLVADWIMLWIETQFMGGATQEDMRAYIMEPVIFSDELTQRIESSLQSRDIMSLNLAHDWLHSYLPHVLQKINRVSFGLLSLHDLALALAQDPYMPQTRAYLAIPFIGKDVPSPASEFAHPDIIIGLTYMAYRYEGLRYTDFTQIIEDLRQSMLKELGPYAKRPSCIRYIRWVLESGGIVRGADAKLVNSIQSQALASVMSQHVEAIADVVLGTDLSHTHTADTMHDEDDVNEEDDLHNIIINDGDDLDSSMVIEHSKPEQTTTAVSSHTHTAEVVNLRLLKRSNIQQMDVLFRLLRRQPMVIQWYLNDFIFPTYTRHQHTKLSASGVELGGDMLFKRRLGFSGTPSDLLPLELGQCQYEKCSDGEMTTLLTTPSIVSYSLMPQDWNVYSLLKHVATATNADGTHAYHALIDTGALITGLTNLQVAEYLLTHGLFWADGVVFLDELDRKMILVRATRRVLKLEQCGIPLHKRFAFYDQVHTTGMDISHRLDACAAVTLGKDMVFRDYAQGTYRMRNIGRGQTIHLLVTPEIITLIYRTLNPTAKTRKINNITQSDVCDVITPYITSGYPLMENVNPSTGVCDTTTHRLLIAVNAWMVVNSMTTERTQFCQLCVQNATNVWRKNAFSKLLLNYEYFNSEVFPEPREYQLSRVQQLEKQKRDMLEQQLALAKSLVAKSQIVSEFRTRAKHDKRILRLSRLQRRRTTQFIRSKLALDILLSLHSFILKSNGNKTSTSPYKRKRAGDLIAEFNELAVVHTTPSTAVDTHAQSSTSEPSVLSVKPSHTDIPSLPAHEMPNISEIDASSILKLLPFTLIVDSSTPPSALRHFFTEMDQESPLSSIIASMAKSPEIVKIIAQFLTFAGGYKHAMKKSSLRIVDDDSDGDNDSSDVDVDGIIAGDDNDDDANLSPEDRDKAERATLRRAEKLRRPDLDDCLDVFKEHITMEIEQCVPKPRKFVDSLAERVKDHQHLLESSEQKTICQSILDLARSTANDVRDYSLTAEMVQTMEEEKEKEVEQEQEKEMEIEKFIDLAYSRDHETQVPWAFSNLAKSVQDNPQFYQLSQFQVHQQSGIPFPNYVLVSRNYFDNTWTGARRVKNVSMAIEWVPNQGFLEPFTRDGQSSPADITTMMATYQHELDTIFSMLDRQSANKLNVFELAQLLTLLISTQSLRKDTSQPSLTLQASLEQHVLFQASSTLSANSSSHFLQDGGDARVNIAQALQDEAFLLFANELIQKYASEQPPSTGVDTTAGLDHTTPAAEDEYTIYPIRSHGQVRIDLDRRCITLDDLKRIFTSGVLYPGEVGRYYVILSLAEAETIRRIVHGRQGNALVSPPKSIEDHFPSATKTTVIDVTAPPTDMSDIAADASISTSVSLRCASHGNFVIDKSYKHIAGIKYQNYMAWQIMRLVNCDIFFTDDAIAGLIRILDATTPSDRRLFFSRILGSRRRLRNKWDESPVARLFSLVSRLHLLKQRTMSNRLKHGITKSRLPLYDAFRAFDYNSNGTLSPDELMGAFTWLNIPVQPSDILDLFELIPHAISNGHITYREFCALLKAGMAKPAKALKRGDAGGEDLDLDLDDGEDYEDADDNDDANDDDDDDDEADGENAGNLIDLPSIPPQQTEVLQKLLQERNQSHADAVLLQKQQLQDDEQRIVDENKRIQEELEASRANIKYNPEYQRDPPSIYYDFTQKVLPKDVMAIGDVVYHESPDGHVPGFTRVHAHSGLLIDFPPGFKAKAGVSATIFFEIRVFGGYSKTSVISKKVSAQSLLQEEDDLRKASHTVRNLIILKGLGFYNEDNDTLDAGTGNTSTHDAILIHSISGEFDDIVKPYLHPKNDNLFINPLYYPVPTIDGVKYSDLRVVGADVQGSALASAAAYLNQCRENLAAAKQRVDEQNVLALGTSDPHMLGTAPSLTNGVSVITNSKKQQITQASNRAIFTFVPKFTGAAALYQSNLYMTPTILPTFREYRQYLDELEVYTKQHGSTIGFPLSKPSYTPSDSPLDPTDKYARDRQLYRLLLQSYEDTVFIEPQGISFSDNRSHHATNHFTGTWFILGIELTSYGYVITSYNNNQAGVLYRSMRPTSGAFDFEQFLFGYGLLEESCVSVIDVRSITVNATMIDSLVAGVPKITERRAWDCLYCHSKNTNGDSIFCSNCNTRRGQSEPPVSEYGDKDALQDGVDASNADGDKDHIQENIEDEDDDEDDEDEDDDEDIEEDDDEAEEEYNDDDDDHYDSEDEDEDY